MEHRIALALRCIAFAALATTARAQSTILTLLGESDASRFGWAVSGMGDVDQDGVPDLLVGAFKQDGVGPQGGRVSVISGATGLTLRSVDGAGLDYLGFSVDGLPDIDGDGIPDFLAGATQATLGGSPHGYARAYSGATGATLFNTTGEQTGDWYGFSVSAAGDVDHDGVEDVIVGAPLNDFAAHDAGAAYVYSGRTGAPLHTFRGGAANDFFGWSVAGAGDVDGDGWPDLIVGAIGSSPGGLNLAGSAQIFSGHTFGLIRAFAGGKPIDQMGQSVAGAGDQDGDGFAEVIVGSTGVDWQGLSGVGGAQVFSGSDGSVRFAFVGHVAGGELGFAVARAGDTNGDGFEDVIVGAELASPNGDYAGEAFVYSGLDGSELLHWVGANPDGELGAAVDAAGDVNGDGFADVIAGAPFDGFGRATVFSGFDCLPVAYCTAKVNSLGCTPAIGFTGYASASSGAPFLIQASQVLNNKYGILFYGLAPAALPFQDGTLCVLPPITRTSPQLSGGNPPPRDCSGAMSLDFNALIQGGGDPHLFVGAQIYAQYWYRDPQSPSTTGFSNALRFFVCQ